MHNCVRVGVQGSSQSGHSPYVEHSVKVRSLLCYTSEYAYEVQIHGAFHSTPEHMDFIMPKLPIVLRSTKALSYSCPTVYCESVMVGMYLVCCQMRLDHLFPFEHSKKRILDALSQVNKISYCPACQHIQEVLHTGLRETFYWFLEEKGFTCTRPCRYKCCEKPARACTIYVLIMPRCDWHNRILLFMCTGNELV
jgi:hypothetical protein